jgi:hypothetical protein
MSPLLVLNLGGAAVELGQVARHSKIPMHAAAFIVEVTARLEATGAMAREAAGRLRAGGQR